MKKLLILSTILLTSFTFTGCTKSATTVETDSVMVEPTASPEAMMNAPLATPMVKATPIDISVDAQLKSTKPTSTSDDPKSIQTDLKNTTIVNESFN